MARFRSKFGDGCAALLRYHARGGDIRLSDTPFIAI